MHTGSRAFCFLVALAATGTECASAAPGVAPDHYRVEAKLVSLPAAAAREFGASVPSSGFYSNEQVARLVGQPRSSTLSFPSVDAAETLPSQIAVTRKVNLPHVGAHQVGVTLSVVPADTRSQPRVFSILLKDVRFAGYQDRSATKPVVNERNLKMGVTESQYYWCFSLPPLHKVRAAYDANGRRMASIADANERQLLFVKITRG